MWRFDDLLIVNEVIKQKSFSKASKSLNIPSSTISRRVSEFEAAIGVRLLERNSRKIALTDKGALLFKQCNTQLQTIKNDVNAISELNSLPVGPLKITAPITLGGEILSPFFCKFAHKYPQINLELQLTNTLEDILDDSFDVAIRVGPLADSGFIGQHLFSTKSVLVASPEYIAKHKLDICNINALQECHFLSYQKEPHKLMIINNNTAAKTKLEIPVTPTFTSSSTTMLRNAANNHLGVALLPHISVIDAIKSKTLINIFSEYHIGNSTHIYAVYPSKQHVSERLDLFLTELKRFTEPL